MLSCDGAAVSGILVFTKNRHDEEFSNGSKKIMVLAIGVFACVWGYSALAGKSSQWDKKHTSAIEQKSQKRIVGYQAVTFYIDGNPDKCIKNIDGGFNKEIKNLISEGWEPIGGFNIETVVSTHSGYTGKVICFISQGMVKYK